MDKRGRIATEILVFMILVVAVSAVIFFLVSIGAIKVKENVPTQPILNTEFLPGSRSGYLALKTFEFCDFVGSNFECEETKNEFRRAENVYVRFLVESSTYNRDVALIRNYQILNPLGEVVFEADQKNNYFFEITSNKQSEPVVFADYFVMDDDAQLGEYTLKVIIENPLLDKKVMANKKFMVVE
ncbi:MAG: hypothetical protein KKA62_01775 [Nanoarchaeota archaeon]|nr:hypothetical protein [Nanoarchaeota archaeon]MBU1644144.1 hypothetical protein [Nanoarchaeota archaeon]MBU1976662.1 hypothetical protein [Nanoarchaeota archaeon]